MNKNDVAKIKELIQLAVKYARNVETDEEALELTFLYKEWNRQLGRELVMNEYVQYNEVLYKVLQNHIAIETYCPFNTPSLFAKVLIDMDGNILDWEQPVSTNAYMKGDKVRFEEKIYESLIDYNTWSPALSPTSWKEIIK